MPSFKKEEKKVCVKLSCLVEKKPIIQKPIIKKPQKSKIKKLKPMPKPKPKKVKIVKTVPVVMPVKKEKIIEPEPEVKEVKKEPEIVPQEPIEEAATQEVAEEVEEDPHAMQEQLVKDYLDENTAKIRQLINDNLYYPRSARKRGKVGEVIVRFKLLKDATVQEVEVISSKSEILSRAAKKTINSLSGEFPKPKEELVIKVPIDYRLKN